MASSGVSFLVTIYMAKTITVEDMGVYAFYVAVYSLCGSFITSGVDRTFVKFIGNGERDYSSLLSLYLLITLFCILFFLLLGIFLIPFLRFEIWLGVIAVGPFVCVQLGAVIFRGKLEKKNEILLIMSISLINSISTFILLSIDKTAKSPISADFASLVIPSILITILFLKRLGGVPSFFFFCKNEKKLVVDFFTFAKPLWLAGIAFSGRSQLSNFLIRYYLGYQSLGVFFFSRHLLGLATKPVDILTKVLLAGFSIKNDVEINNYKSVLSLNLIVFPAICLLIVFSLPFGLEMVGLDEYKGASLYVSILSLALPLTCVQAIMGVVNVVFNVPDVSQKTYVLSAVVSIPFSVVLIKYFGVVGACCVPVLFSFLLFFFNVKFLSKCAPQHSRIAFKVGVGAQLIYATALFTGYYFSNVFISMVLVFLYLVFGHFSKVWNLYELFKVLSSSISNQRA